MMKYMIIYNPSSGREAASNKVMQAARYLLEKQEAEVTLYATKKKDDAMNKATEACREGYDLIIACGGDGTVHEVINGIMACENRSKLAIFPAGTINDFAEQLGLPSNPEDVADLLLNPHYDFIDIGFLGNKFFMNVLSGGAFTNIPHSVGIEAKTLFGKHAYYLQAALEIPENLEKCYKIKYTLDDTEYNIDTFLFLVCNTAGAGGFKNLLPNAKYNDGLLDIIVFEKASPADLLQIFTGVFNGNHINHPKVHYFQAKNIKIECDDEISLDIDGEAGGNPPVEIVSVNRAIEILIP